MTSSDGRSSTGCGSIDVTTFPTAKGAPVVTPSSELPPGPHRADGAAIIWTDVEDVCRGPIERDLASTMDVDVSAVHHESDPDVLALCTELRALQVALALVAFYDGLGSLVDWDQGLRASLAEAEIRRGG
jgi:hypothetical protein